VSAVESEKRIHHKGTKGTKGNQNSQANRAAGAVNPIDHSTASPSRLDPLAILRVLRAFVVNSSFPSTPPPPDGFAAPQAQSIRSIVPRLRRQGSILWRSFVSFVPLW
jgi:hypothetical protein